MKTITLKIKKDYAMKLLHDLEKSDAISLIRKKRKPAYQPKRMLTKEVLVARALESEKAIKEKKILSISELAKEMKNW